MVNAENSPTRGSTPAITENAMASGISASATTRPPRTSMPSSLGWRSVRSTDWRSSGVGAAAVREGVNVSVRELVAARSRRREGLVRARTAGRIMGAGALRGFGPILGELRGSGRSMRRTGQSADSWIGGRAGKCWTGPPGQSTRRLRWTCWFNGFARMPRCPAAGAQCARAGGVAAIARRNGPSPDCRGGLPIRKHRQVPDA